MKRLLSFCSTAFFVGSLFTTQFNLSSCTKEKFIHDTTIVNHTDTTVINHTDTLLVRDTVKLVLAPCRNPNESSVDSYYSNGTGIGTSQIVMGYWTAQSSPERNRTYIKFDYTEVPSEVVIISAQLSVYANRTPAAGNFIDAHFGNANAIFIQRVISDWSPVNISWNNQPTSTSDNEVSVPQTTSNFQDDINIDVSDLVRDMLVKGNDGFAMKLQNENIVYNIRQYASSYNADMTKVPKLVIYYKKK